MDVLNCGQLGLGNGNREGKGTPAAPCTDHKVNHEVQGAHSGAVFDGLLVDCIACR